MMQQRQFAEGDVVDFVIVGSGAAGGVLAKELSTGGFSVVVLEQGPWRQSHEFRHDEFGNWMLARCCRRRRVSRRRSARVRTSRRIADGHHRRRCCTRRASAAAVSTSRRTSGVCGPSTSASAVAARHHPGTGFADWPITYEELEPYYTKVDWEIGVSGAPGPNDPPRSRPYPMPPMPVKSSGVLLEAGARKLGLNAQPAPLAITSQPFDGRSACAHCGFCMGYGCEMGAKSSTLA
jgi:choline dehydrogenase-like flavoprotein